MITLYLVTVRVAMLTACLSVHMNVFYKSTSHRLFHPIYITHRDCCHGVWYLFKYVCPTTTI